MTTAKIKILLNADQQIIDSAPQASVVSGEEIEFYCGSPSDNTQTPENAAHTFSEIGVTLTSEIEGFKSRKFQLNLPDDSHTFTAPFVTQDQTITVQLEGLLKQSSSLTSNATGTSSGHIIVRPPEEEL